MKSVSAPEIPIPISNKGHQMMLKLGWSGGVLGASGAGLETPITASTMYRGRIGLGGTLAFPELPSENQAFLQECKVVVIMAVSLNLSVHHRAVPA